MRATLGVLWQAGEAAPSRPCQVTPVSGHARLDEPTRGVPAAGPTIRTRAAGEPRPLPAYPPPPSASAS